MSQRLTSLRHGSVAIAAAAAWNVVDVVVHVLADRVESLRIAGNVVVIIAALLSVAADRLGRPKLSALVCGLATGLVLGLNTSWAVTEGELPGPAVVFIGVSTVLTGWATIRFLVAAGRPDSGDGGDTLDGENAGGFPLAWGGLTLLVLVVAAALSAVVSGFRTTLDQLHDDRLVQADYWGDELEILSAGFGFDKTVGTPGDSFETTRGAGASWLEDPDCVADDGPLSSANPAAFINRLSRGEVSFDDGLPIVTSWPVLPSTMHTTDFRFTLNDGSQVFPNAVTMVPNWELNERTTMVAFGQFGNRFREDDPDVIFPIKLEIVDDGSPLIFVGPGGVTQSGVGLTFETDNSPYFEGATGPRLVGAKLNRIGDRAEGEGGVGLLERLALPNDEFALYGGGDFKVRILTTGGFSPDGLTGVTPDQYEDFFRLHATGLDGGTVLMTEVGVDYELAGGTLRVVGLSDLGKPAGGDVHYDDCYFEDSDNYIDIILEGDEAAARGLTILEIPAESDDDYLSFYNPGGPGPEPFPEVRYNQPGPQDLEPIIIALDDPMRVSYP